MRTRPRDVILFAITRPPFRTDIDGPIAGRQSQKRMAPPPFLRVSKQNSYFNLNTQNKISIPMQRRMEKVLVRFEIQFTFIVSRSLGRRCWTG